VIEELAQTLETEPFDVFVALVRKRLQDLSVRLYAGQVIARPQAEAIAAQLLELVRGSALGRLTDRPGDALRLLDALSGTGYTELETERPHYQRECSRRYPPPPPPPWREIAELHVLAATDPADCQLGPPIVHLEFADRLGATGIELPGELLALYAACSHVTLMCRHVAIPAVRICAGEALRIREGRVILVERIRRQPATLFVEQPSISIAQQVGTWWLVLEDDRAPATRRPLDLQGLLRFALLRREAPSLELLLTDLAWRRFFV
jgi:hypothetical protein